MDEKKNSAGTASALGQPPLQCGRVWGMPQSRCWADGGMGHTRRTSRHPGSSWQDSLDDLQQGLPMLVTCVCLGFCCVELNGW